MVIIKADTTEKLVKLTVDEINMIIEELERQPYNVYNFINYYGVIKKFKDAKCVDKVEDNSFLQIGENCKLCGVKGVCHKMLAHHRLGKCVKCTKDEVKE